MSEWRFARGWTDSELKARLARAAHLRPSFDVVQEHMTTEHGWHQDFSEAVIAREPPGPPLPGAAFARAWRLVDSYAFSDPRIVRGHFDASSPLLGRRMLLEIRAMGLHFLGPVVVGAVRDESDRDSTTRGFRYDTLEGHFERGSRWFVVHKDHRTGEITFRLSAAWQRGELPNALYRWGFRLFSRRYQHAWHRLAHARLRVMLGWTGTEPIAIEAQLAHQGPPLRMAPFGALAGHRGHFAPMSEHGAHRAGDSRRLVDVAALGCVCGARSLLAPALIAHQLEHQDMAANSDNRVARILSNRKVASALAGLAVAEMAADKTPFIPSRTDLLPLAGRVAMGAVVGAAVVGPGQRSAATLAGAAGAGLGAWAFSRLRKQATQRVGMSNVVAGLGEDALAVGLGLFLVRRLRRR